MHAPATNLAAAAAAALVLLVRRVSLFGRPAGPAATATAASASAASAAPQGRCLPVGPFVNQHHHPALVSQLAGAVAVLGSGSVFSSSGIICFLSFFFLSSFWLFGSCVVGLVGSFFSGNYLRAQSGEYISDRRNLLVLYGSRVRNYMDF
jgi:hypothetical protein